MKTAAVQARKRAGWYIRIQLIILILFYIALHIGTFFLVMFSSTELGPYVETSVQSKVIIPQTEWFGTWPRQVVEFTDVSAEHPDGVILGNGCSKTAEGTDLAIECDGIPLITILNYASQPPGRVRFIFKRQLVSVR